MSLTLYFHPLSSFCQKVLTALYEKEISFEKNMVDFMDPAESEKFREIWPIRQFPVLRDTVRDKTIPESSLIIEYVDRQSPGAIRLLPDDPEAAFETRWLDRFFDLHVQVPMQKIVTDRLRHAGNNDSFGVDEAKSKLKTAYDVLAKKLDGRTWAIGDRYTMADCAASPALFYANMVVPFGGDHANVSHYLDRLMQRPSFVRVLEEARPYLDMVPK